MRRSNLRLWLGLMLLLLNIPLSAQEYEWQRCDTCFKGFDKNFTGHRKFVIGVEFSFHPDTIMTHFNASLAYMYGGVTNLRELSDTATWMANPDLAVRSRDRMDWNFWKRAIEGGLKVIYLPQPLSTMGISLYSVENYYGQMYDSLTGTIPLVDVRDFLTHQREDHNINEEYDTVRRNFVYSVTIPETAPATDTLIVSRPRYIAAALKPSNPIHFQELKAPGGMSYTDSSTYFDLSFTVYTDTLKPIFEELDNNDPIVYAIVFGRDTTSLTGDTCRCAWYIPIDTLYITKGKYLDPTTVVAEMGEEEEDRIPYRNVTFTMNLFRDSVYAPRGTDSTRTSDSLPRFHAPLQTLHWREPVWQWPNDAPACNVHCDSLLASLKTQGRVPASTFIPSTGAVEYSDLWFEVYTTRKVEVTFLRSRVSTHLLTIAERGDADSLIAAPFDDILNDSTLSYGLNRAFDRFAVPDEPNYYEFASSRLISSTVQRRLLADSATRMTSPLANAYNGYNALRAMAGDYDTTDIKMIGAYLTHVYPIGGLCPVPYANPWKTDGGLTNPYYDDMWCFNTDTNYWAYTASSQLGIDIKKANTCEAIDIAKHRYLHLAPPMPVYNNIQSAGYLETNGQTGYSGQWQIEWGAESKWRPPTPEEIKAQTWLSLACDVDGIMFSDVDWTGHHLGVLNALDGSHSQDWDTLQFPLDGYWHAQSQYRIPKMWIGMNQRFNAIKEMTQELTLIAPVYETLVFNKEQIGVESSGGDFSKIPMLDTVYTRQAQPYMLPDSNGIYTDGPADSLHRTFLEVSHFRPPANSLDRINGVRYLVVANKRCWPIDYDTTYQDGNDGLGAIDVRKPVIKLRNVTGIVADSFVVELVGHESQWRHTGKFGDTIGLKWTPPGWGGLYRIRPIPTGVSEFGVAFSNAVRSVNPSSSAQNRDRLTVYERDSVIYLRAIDSAGRWSQEWMISDTADTAFSGGERRGNNMFPAVAVSRGNDRALVVWERRDTSGTTVEALYIDTLPTRRFIEDLPATSTIPSSAARWRLSSPVAIGNTSWRRYTPSVCAVQGGWLVASASPLKGVRLLAVREELNSPLDPDSYDTISITRICMPSGTGAGRFGQAIDSTTLLPTLGSVPMWENIILNGGRDAGLIYTDYNTPGSVIPGTAIPALTAHLQVAHLAYQQGTPDQAGTQFIMYNRIGVDFPSLTPTPRSPKLWVSPTEHVTQGLDECGFIHPCIAVDSVRVGVSFQINTLIHRYAALRFRDSLDALGNAAMAFDPNARLLRRIGPWSTTVYRWGGDFWRTDPGGQGQESKAIYYERPSVTEFPTVERQSLISQPEGALSWVWTNPLGTAGIGGSLVMLYRYGWLRPEQILRGHHPTMTFAPNVGETPFAASSVFHRGDTTMLFRKRHPQYDSSRYYPAYLRGASEETGMLFTANARTNEIYSYVTLRDTAAADACIRRNFTWGVGFRQLPIMGNRLTGPWLGPMLPPSFFAPSNNGHTIMDTLPKTVNITRTGTFAAGGQPVKVERMMMGDSAVVSWLDTFPYDSARSRPADIYIIPELVRIGDGAVLWRGDTATARGTGAGFEIDTVTVPVQTYASSGTQVYIRLRPEVSEGLVYLMNTGFQFVDVHEEPPKLKIAHPTRDEVVQELPFMRAGKLQAMVIPNPAREYADLVLSTEAAGTIHVEVYDLLGSRTMELSPLEVAQPGTYRRTLDLEGLQDGTYLVVVESGDDRVTVRLTVSPW